MTVKERNTPNNGGTNKGAARAQKSPAPFVSPTPGPKTLAFLPFMAPTQILMRSQRKRVCILRPKSQTSAAETVFR